MKLKPPAYPPHLARKLANLATTNPQLFTQLAQALTQPECQHGSRSE